MSTEQSTSYSKQELSSLLGLDHTPPPPPRRTGRSNTLSTLMAPKSDGERTQTMLSIYGHLLAQGTPREGCLMIARMWNATNTPPLDDVKVVSTLDSMIRTHERNQVQDEDLIAQLNQNHATVLIGGKFRVIKESFDPISGLLHIEFLSRADFMNFHAALPEINGRPAPQAWLSHPEKRQYQGVVFDPGNTAPSNYYNLWQGFAVEPAPGDCSLFLQHLKDNIANGNEMIYAYIINWMADAIQNPARLPGVAIVLRGRQGTGKGVLMTEFGKLFGSHFKHILHADHLTGKFNAHLDNALFVAADEVVWGGDRQREGALKTLITEATRQLERKGIDPITVNNYVRLMMASNNSWVTPAGMEERRFMVLDVGDQHMQDHAYFSAITQQMANGGREALLHYLLNVDLTDVNIRKFPQTQALLDQKIRGFTPVQQFWHELLLSGDMNFFPGSVEEFEWPSTVSSSHLYSLYLDHCTTLHKQHPLSNSVFFREWRPLCPDAQPTKTRFMQHNGIRRVNAYKLPSLADCRKIFETQLGQTIDWEGANTEE